MSSALLPLRQIQVLQVHKLFLDGDAPTIAAACEIVGINERTYRRWREATLADLQAQIDEQSQMIGQQLLDAQPAIVAELLDRLLGDENNKAAVQYWPAYYDRFQQLLDRTMPDPSPDTGDERAYLEQDEPWLEGPVTVRTKLPDGTEVTVTRPGQHVVEAAYEVVPDNQQPSPALDQSITATDTSGSNLLPGVVPLQQPPEGHASSQHNTGQSELPESLPAEKPQD